MFSPIQGFEDALSSLIKDVKNIECEHNRMEDMFNKYILFTELLLFNKNIFTFNSNTFSPFEPRERESHSAHLASIEAEMDHQVARVSFDQF